ncbi:MAG: DUF6629 family protein [Chitinophagaceae bacterium]
MCFSAGASFGASAVLSLIGSAAIVKARTIPQGLFAGIPLIFSVQQLAEGILWLSFKNTGLEAAQPFFTYTFLVFAMMLWPVWIPFTLRLLEKDSRRKKIMSVLLGIGVLVSMGVGCVLMLYDVHVISTHHHIHYRVDFPTGRRVLILPFSLLYFIATIITPFISGIKRMKWIGVGFLASYLFAIIFYSGFVVSVWCYFAAILSVVVLWILSDLRKSAL